MVNEEEALWSFYRRKVLVSSSLHVLAGRAKVVPTQFLQSEF